MEDDTMLGNWELGIGNTPSLFRDAQSDKEDAKRAYYDLHSKELSNLYNMSFWRSRMTDQHKEMRSHPNRSPEWIPQEILKVREQRENDWLQLTLEDSEWDATYTGWSSWKDGDKCNCCNAAREETRLRVKQELDGNGWTYNARLRYGWCNFCTDIMQDKISSSVKLMMPCIDLSAFCEEAGKIK